MQRNPSGADHLRRRRDTALRLPPLDCGCRDPWTCPDRRPPLHADAVRATVEHLERAGLAAAWTDDDLRVLWRAGHHDLARQQLRGGAA